MWGEANVRGASPMSRGVVESRLGSVDKRRPDGRRCGTAKVCSVEGSDDHRVDLEGMTDSRMGAWEQIGT